MCVNCESLVYGEGKNCYKRINNSNKQNADKCEECSKYYYVLSSYKTKCEPGPDNKISLDSKECLEGIAHCDEYGGSSDNLFVELGIIIFI